MFAFKPFLYFFTWINLKYNRLWTMTFPCPKAFSESLPLADMAAAPPAMVRAKMAQGGVHVTLDWVAACVQVQEWGDWGPHVEQGDYICYQTQWGDLYRVSWYDRVMLILK